MNYFFYIMQASILLTGLIDSRVYNYLNGLGFLYNTYESYDRRIPLMYTTDMRLLNDMKKHNYIVIGFEEDKTNCDFNFINCKDVSSDALCLEICKILEKSFPLINIPERDQHYTLYGEVLRLIPDRTTQTIDFAKK